MKYPRRPESHVTEAASWRLLQSLAPDEWIVREVSERDYGIDAYIELVSKDGQVTGRLMSAQLKGVQGVDWKQSDSGVLIATSPSVKTSTAAYWLNLPVPVFLFVADLSESNIYVAPVKVTIRAQFEKLSSQENMSFRLAKSFDLRSKDGLQLLDWFFTREMLQGQFSFHITNLISQVDAFGEFIRMNQNRDIFAEVEAERHLQFRALYESCRMASLYLGEEWSVESLRELYERDREEWKDEYVYLHEKTLGEALEKIEKLFPALVRNAIALVSQTEASYWQYRDPVFFNLCRNDDLTWILKRIEHEAGL